MFFARTGLGWGMTPRGVARLAAGMILACVASTAIAGSPALGWQEIPNTRIRPLCPLPNADPGEFGVCQSVTGAWSGGAFDSQRNRLYILGGGHADYAGNEVYMLDVNLLQLSRLNEPSFPVRDGCVDGTQLELCRWPARGAAHLQQSRILAGEQSAADVRRFALEVRVFR